MTSIVVHYKELALKGRNRPWFVQILVRNLRAALAGLDIRASPLGDGPDRDRPRRRDVLGIGFASRVRRVFGIANFSYAARAPHDFQTLASAILADLGDRLPLRFACPHGAPTSACLSRRRRSNGKWAACIKEAKGWRVDLDDPALTIHLEMLPDHAFYFFGKEPGAGGLPTGTGGRVACLLSGGIDSPVAAYRMMRRGCSVLLDPFPQLSDPVARVAGESPRNRGAADAHQLRSRLLLVPFGELQQQVLLAVPPQLRVVIYRRLMLRIAEQLARRWRARALVTGEVIGQVASQTLENMTAIAEATTMEVLRPLVGMDKDEIVAQAQRLGTYPISIIPDQDCCQLFTPRHPATRARPTW